MKKLKLNLDEIKVESFETLNVNLVPKGTINGQSEDTLVDSCELCGIETSIAAGCKYSLQVNCTNNTCGEYTCGIDDPC
jgi:hypothetical protein